MLEKTPAWLGRATYDMRAGVGGLAVARLNSVNLIGRDDFTLGSPAFEFGEAIPTRFTADADRPASPPLQWTEPPEGTQGFVLIVEDPDAPAFKPFCHYLAWGIGASTRQLGEGERPPFVGRNAFGKSEWLPHDPPTGHGKHEYIFQLFAVNETPDLPTGTHRAGLLEEMQGHVRAVALFAGTYERPG